jgi:PAS domain S-box-containing protein
MTTKSKAVEPLEEEIAELRRRLEEAEETIEAIRSGSVDAFLVQEHSGERVYTLETADRPYRVLVESMQQGALTISLEGTILYGNPRLAELLEMPHGRLAGLDMRDIVSDEDRAACEALLLAGRSAPAQGEARLKRGSGTTMPVHLTVGALPPDAGAALCVLVTDLTEHKHYEELLRTQAALHESEERFRLAADAQSGLIYERRDTGRVERSAGLLPLLGYRPEEAEPTVAWWSERIHPEDRARLREVFRAIVADRSPFMGEEYRVLHRDGIYRHVLDRSRILYDDRGRVSRAVGCVLDITELVRAQEAFRDSDQRLRLALRAAQAGVWDWDLSSGELIWSPETFELFGNDSTQGPLLEDDWERFVHPDDLDAVRRAVREALEGEVPEFHAEFRVLHPRRGVRWLVGLGRVWRSPDGTPIRMAGINLDLTAKREVEEILRESDRRKDEFLAMLAHELRNPLSAISNAVQLLQAARLDETSAWATGVCNRQLIQLTRLIDDLMDVSRITRGKISLKTQVVELGAVVRLAAEAVRPLIEEKKHTLAISLGPDPLLLVADPARLAQMLANQLANGAKYSEKGGRIELTAAREGAAIVIRVKDEGIGIPADMLTGIFELFAQVDKSLDRSQGGLGIGLSLVKRLAEMHGGSVTAESDGPGTGSTFTLRLPALVEPDEARS